MMYKVILYLLVIALIHCALKKVFVVLDFRTGAECRPYCGQICFTMCLHTVSYKKGQNCVIKLRRTAFIHVIKKLTKYYTCNLSKNFKGVFVRLELKGVFVTLK